MNSFWNKKINFGLGSVRIKTLLGIAVLLIALDGFHIVDVPFINFDFGNFQSAVSGIVTDVTAPQGEENGVQVNVKISVYEGMDVNTPGLAGTAVDTTVRVLKLNDDGSYSLLEQVTTSSGVVTLNRMYWTGSDLYLQVRPADPDSADPYVSPIVKRSIPSARSAEFSDTVMLDPVYVRDVTATAPTLAVKDGSGNAISDNSANYFNTTDTTMQIMIHSIDSDTFYGPEDFVDQKTGYEYDGGVFFIWKGTTNQPFTGYKYTWSDPTYVYYVWELSPYLVDDSSAGVATDILSVILQTDGSNLNADSSVTLDIVDIIWVRASGFSSSSLIDGGSLSPTAITTKVA